MLNEDDLNLKAYKLAHYLDFSDEIYCYEEDANKPDKVGVFLGANHNRYLLDNKLKAKDDFRRFIHSTAGESDLEKSKELSFRTCG